ncbi:hypothetical protein [Rheinheimera sp.]|uniref:hypothetical protein n=1 Tax=Rheinheimera sp. TaxID=1869214 RepID=UPI00307D40CE
MAVFFLVLKDDQQSQADFDKLRTRLIEKFGVENLYSISPSQHLMAHNELFMPQQIADFIGEDFSKGSNGPYLLVPVSAYWGYHDNALWSWLAGKV